MAKPIPDGYHSITPSLVVKGGARAIDFYKRAFGAQELMRMPGPDGQTVVHAELKFGDSIVMLTDEMPGMSGPSPTTLKGTPGYLFMYVPDVDAAWKRAVEAGCKATMPLADMFWGDRFGKLEDPFGHQWGLATHREDVTPEEMDRRARQAMAQMAQGKT